ncbi:MAG: DUF1295 domain-containing protein, partial [Micrococcales bacterium]|nr:DUF1295 domain-containing protein [Micrococcales bacterium]
MSAIEVNLWIAAAITAGCWIASLITREYSWVDRIWSIAPAVYLWVYAAHAHDARVTLMAILVTCWAARLSFNFARRGGYRPGGEDYRWKVLRDSMPAWQFQALNLVFIAIVQNAVVFAMTLPAWTASHPGTRPLGVGDVIAA